MTLLLEAGYQNNLQIVFTGDVRTIAHTRDGASWNSRFQCSDGGAAWSGGTTRVSFAPGTPIDRVITKLAGDLGVGVGNLTQTLLAGGFNVKQYANGFSASGLASRELDRVLSAAGLQWSIQDGALQLLKPGATLPGQGYLLNASTGLIGSPQYGEQDPKRGSYLKVKTLLLPSIRPGSLVQLDAVGTKGGFRVEKATHSGDTDAQEWYSELECTRVG
jgi:hypothetical protein